MGAELENRDQFTDGSAAECDIDAVFARCAGSSCHQGSAGEPPLGAVDFFDEGFAQNMLGLDAEYPGVRDPENCPSTPELIVDPGNPSESLLLKKVRGDHSCGNGMPLPYPATALSTDELSCLEAWVDELIEAQSGRGGAGGTSSNTSESM